MENTQTDHPHKMSGRTLEELNETELQALQVKIAELLAEKLRSNPGQDFHEPKEKKLKINEKTTADPTTPSIPLHNRFAPLSNNDQDMADVTEESNPVDTTQDTEFPQIRRTKTSKKPSNQGNPQPAQIAPIFLKEKDKWNHASQLIKNEKINTTKCKLVATGIQIDPATEEDYRKLNKLFEREKLQYYTYQLRSEKNLKIVLRGIPQEFTEEDVRKDLEKRGYPVEKTVRMNGKDGKPAPLVLIEIKRMYKSIYDLKECCELAVTAEPLKIRDGVIQCHKCQMFGHAQKNCHIDFKCMKCGQNHSTHLCEKSPTIPPKCANCGGEHLSTHLKCPKNPNNPANNPKPKLTAAPSPKENPWFKKREEKKESHNEEITYNKNNANDDLANTIGKMLITLSNTNATIEQKLQFIQQTEKIIQIFNAQK